MVYLKTEQKFKWGQRNVIPVVGEVSISDEGLIEVESLEIAKEIEATNIGFVVLTKETGTTTQLLNPKVEDNDLGKKSDENDLDGEDQDNDRDELLKSLDNKTLAELKDLAKPFSASEWRALNKEKLTEYLKSKL